MAAPDLDVRVRVKGIDGETFLNYVVDSPSGAIEMDPVSIQSQALKCQPDSFQANLFKRIECLHNGFDIDGTQVLDCEIPAKLEGIGRDLYDELFPPLFRELYRKVRRQVKSILIVSEEPWIPWEMVKPYDDSRLEDVIDDDFLCAQFSLTLWLTGALAAPSVINAGRIACVLGEPQGAKLPYVSEERALIASLADSQLYATDVSPQNSTCGNFKELLKTRSLGLVHVASHGEFVEEQPNESSILLADGHFRASDLHGPTATNIRNSRPLVFMNACRVTRQGWALTGLGGWSDRWVQRCGCGCFLGPQWIVSDELAYAFARTFYEKLGEEECIGDAAKAARVKLRELEPNSTAWLSFRVFGHPNGQVSFKQEQLAAKSSSCAELAASGINTSEILAAFSSNLQSGHIPRMPEPYVAHCYTLLQTGGLIGRSKELRYLSEWINNPGQTGSRARILNIVAIGGMGKSALIWKWFNDLAEVKFSSLKGRMWWSFYEYGATFDEFIIRSLAYVSGRSVKATQRLPPADREIELLEILDRSPFLIVLDGLERIMIAYAQMDAARLMDDELDIKAGNVVVGAMGLPESAAHSFVGRHALRKMQDPRVGVFLRKMALVQSSRFVVSTRLYPAELQDPHTGQALPGSDAYFLEGLRGIDSLKLWRALRIRGAGHLVLPILDRIQHHPLVIRALAGEVACYRRAPGDFDQWLEDHPGFNLSRLPRSLVQERSHVLAFALRGLEVNSIQVARTIAAFRMPATYDILNGLVSTSETSSLSETTLNCVLTDLEDRGLVGWDREKNLYDMHPLIRGVIWGELATSEQQAVYKSLQRHFESMPEFLEYQITHPGMLAPAVELINSLVHLGRYDEAFFVFNTRIGDALLDYMNSYLAIELMELFFPLGMESLPPLKRYGEQLELTWRLASAYQVNGQIKQASIIFQRLVQEYSDIVIGSAGGYALESLSEILVSLGSLREADEKIRNLLAANRSWKTDGRCFGFFKTASRICMLRGQERLARRVLRRIPRNEVNAFIIDISLAEYALWLGDLDIASALIQRAVEIMNASGQYEVRKKDRHHILCIQAYTMLGLGQVSRVNQQLHQILVSSRVANDAEGEIKSQVGLAEVARRQGDFKQAREFLESALESIERGPFTLLHADASIVLAGLEWAVGNQSRAVEAAEAAYRMAWCDGPPYAYHWGLEKARALLRSFNVSDPVMPTFDERKYPVMEEVEEF